MNSCHEEGVRDRNQAGIELPIPCFLDSGRQYLPKTGNCYGGINVHLSCRPYLVAGLPIRPKEAMHILLKVDGSRNSLAATDV
eukprot:gene25986-biopygen12582